MPRKCRWRPRLGCIARERLTGEAPPRPPLAGLKLVSPWIEEKAGAELDALGLTIDDQAAFAKLSRRLLEDLDLAAAEDRPRSSPKKAATTKRATTGGDKDGRAGRRRRARRRRHRNARRGGRGRARPTSNGSDEMEIGEDEAARRRRMQRKRCSPSPGRRNWDWRRETDYKAFTTRFDEIVEADELCDEEELGAAPRLSRPADGRACRTSSPGSPTGCSGG